VKVATWNINGINSRTQHVLDWCSSAQRPDVLCLQETKCTDARFPVRKLQAAGFPHVEFAGEKAYNGVAILSKDPLTAVQKGFPDDPPEAPKRLISATVNGIRIVNAYAPHGTALESAQMAFKLEWFERLRRHFDRSFSPEENVILAGDLNVAPHELDLWKPSLWRDKTHFSKPERGTMLDLKRWGFADLFRQMNDEEPAYTWWSNFRSSGFEKDRGMRIDFIWASPPLAERCVGCWVDKEPRGWGHPSDHAPVVADFKI
jgi:exodeoxyribonuclease-3